MVSSIMELICLWTVSSLADGAVCIFFSFLTDGVVRFYCSLIYLRMVSSIFYCSLIYLRMVSSVLELICLWTVSSLADGGVCIFFPFLMDGVVCFGINNCLWMVSSLPDGAVCIFFSILTDVFVCILL